MRAGLCHLFRWQYAFMIHSGWILEMIASDITICTTLQQESTYDGDALSSRTHKHSGWQTGTRQVSKVVHLMAGQSSVGEGRGGQERARQCT